MFNIQEVNSEESADLFSSVQGHWHRTAILDSWSTPKKGWVSKGYRIETQSWDVICTRRIRHSWIPKWDRGFLRLDSGLSFQKFDCGSVRSVQLDIRFVNFVHNDGEGCVGVMCWCLLCPEGSWMLTFFSSMPTQTVTWIRSSEIDVLCFEKLLPFLVCGRRICCSEYDNCRSWSKYVRTLRCYVVHKIQCRACCV